MADAENGEHEENFQDDSVAEGLFDTDANQFDTGEGDTSATGQDESGVEDPELEAIKARVKEMEEEAEKLKEMQSEVEKQMNITSPPPTASAYPTIDEKIDADNRSIYVGNVDYTATAEELEQHFHGCGSINRVTIQCDKFTGHPKGFGYIEFADKDSVETSVALDDSLFKGRQIKVSAKRTNRPGISSTNRFPRGRGRGRGGYRGSAGYGGYQGYTPRPRGRFNRYRRSSPWYSPY